MTEQDGLREGWLLKMFPDFWKQLGDRPIYMTKELAKHISDNRISDDRLLDMWNNLAEWVRTTEPYLPSERRQFVYHMQGRKIWAVFGGVTKEAARAITFMFPEDY